MIRQLQYNFRLIKNEGRIFNSLLVHKMIRQLHIHFCMYALIRESLYVRVFEFETAHEKNCNFLRERFRDFGIDYTNLLQRLVAIKSSYQHCMRNALRFLSWH